LPQNDSQKAYALLWKAVEDKIALRLLP